MKSDFTKVPHIKDSLLCIHCKHQSLSLNRCIQETPKWQLQLSYTGTGFWRGETELSNVGGTCPWNVLRFIRGIFHWTLYKCLPIYIINSTIDTLDNSVRFVIDLSSSKLCLLVDGFCFQSIRKHDLWSCIVNIWFCLICLLLSDCVVLSLRSGRSQSFRPCITHWSTNRLNSGILRTYCLAEYLFFRD